MDVIVGSLHERFGLLTGSTERAASTEPIACAQHRTDMRARLFEELRWHTAPATRQRPPLNAVQAEENGTSAWTMSTIYADVGEYVLSNNDFES